MRFHRQIEAIYQWESASTSALSCFVVFLLFRYSFTIVIVIVGLWLWMIYTPVVRETQETSEIAEYKQNLLFIQQFMGAVSIGLKNLKAWKNDTIYWGNPNSARKTKRWLEISFLPSLVISWYFSIGDLLAVVIIISILASNPLVKLAVVEVFFKTKHSVSGAGDTVTERKLYKLYENQRMWVGVWKNFTFPNERNNWSDINGNNMTREEIVLQDGWEWESEWKGEMSSENEEGWEYAPDFTKTFHCRKEFWDYVRRRCWVRTSVRIKPI